MAFVLPGFNAAANYNLTPVVGGIAGPVPGFEGVKSTAFTDALRAAKELEYAAATQFGLAALPQKGAMERLKFNWEEREKERNEFTKPQRMAAIAKLLAPSKKGGQQSRRGGLTGPLDQLRSLTAGFDDLDRSDAIRTAPFYNEVEEFWKETPAPPQPTKVGLPKIVQATVPTSSLPKLNSMEAHAKSRAAFEQSFYESIKKQLNLNTTT